MIRLSTASRETIECLSPLFYVTVFFGGLFALSLVPVLLDRSCAHAGALSQPSSATLEGFGCAEFFLNRYQTLLGIAGALAAAFIAAAPVWRQVGLSGMQAALQLQPVIEGMEKEIRSDSDIVLSIGAIERRIENLAFLANVGAEEGVGSSIIEHILLEIRQIGDMIDVALEREMPQFVGRLRLNKDERDQRNILEKRLHEARRVMLRPAPSPGKSPQEMIDEAFCTKLAERLGPLGYEIFQHGAIVSAQLIVEEDRLRKSASNVQRALAGF
jgi:hypothetical protein